MTIETGRFGKLELTDSDIITFPQGILGFPDYSRFCLIDPNDDTLILWLQSLENMDLAFPVLEPKIFKANYWVKLSAAELRDLKLENVNEAALFNILTIPDDVMEMTANLKAPLVINLKEQIAKQVVLQENEYSLRVQIFKELRRHLMTIQAQKGGDTRDRGVSKGILPINVSNLPASGHIKSLQLG